MDIEKASDEELENIVRADADTKAEESRFHRAAIELDIRRAKKLFEQQEKLYSNIQAQLNKFTHIVRYVSNKPFRSILIAGLTAVLLGVIIEVIAVWVELKLGLIAK